MTLHLFSRQEPVGRGLLVAQASHKATGLNGTQCIQIAERLFDFQHPPQKPLAVPIARPVDLTELKSVCSAVGISVETYDTDEQRPSDRTIQAKSE